MYYSGALIRTTSNWINDSSDIPEESLEPNETTVNGEDPMSDGWGSKAGKAEKERLNRSEK